MRRVLQLSGYAPRPGLLGRPGPEDLIAVWGQSPYAHRGEAAARATGAGLLRVEDAFLRSVRPGRSGGGPALGLMLDATGTPDEGGVHFDSRQPSALERLLRDHPLDDGDLLRRARDGMAQIAALELSKYNIHDLAIAPPEPGYVLVVDQTFGDASIPMGGARDSTFLEMLLIAQEEHPRARILIKTHPETQSGARPGHYGPEHATGRVTLETRPISPQALLAGAVAVYTVSSQLGFEAVLAGHRPRVFGQPFYAGWGLTEDERPVWRRQRKLTRAQLFAAAMILAPVWYDRPRDRLASFEEALDQLEAEVRAFRDDRAGHVACGMRLWKRRPLQAMLGRERRLVFEDRPDRAAARARAEGRGLLVWAGRETPALTEAATGLPLARVEDGFLRSRGLGAELVPPLSLALDHMGIYYDPTRENDLERLIAAGPPPGGLRRAERLVERIVAGGLSKYNLGGALPELPEGHRILVPGQVEDDASIRLGTTDVRSNRDLLIATRARNPGAVLIYKPHPDVEAGLRPGAIPPAELFGLADFVLGAADPAQVIAAVDEVWTMTSTLGFEALLRGKPVTCLGAPFYAGWGLTRDLGAVPARRRARPELAAFAHAALIAYPRYHDPVSGLPCPAEVALERLISGEVPRRGVGNRLLAKAQGILASQSWIWR
ncbi:capsular polysaccharide biosynthesis protein [Frigidibacter sp. MR17.14]